MGILPIFANTKIFDGVRFWCGAGINGLDSKYIVAISLGVSAAHMGFFARRISRTIVPRWWDPPGVCLGGCPMGRT